jgi:hypothetical protein
LQFLQHSHAAWFWDLGVEAVVALTEIKAHSTIAMIETYFFIVNNIKWVDYLFKISSTNQPILGGFQALDKKPE